MRCTHVESLAGDEEGALAELHICNGTFELFLRLNGIPDFLEFGRASVVISTFLVTYFRYFGCTSIVL